jgi:hypothetical protein
MDVSLENLRGKMEPKWANFGREKSLKTTEKVVELMNTEKFRSAATGKAALSVSS